MDKLQRFRGHFYNWYDTRTLEPLRPHYVSTVDSGNLAGHLLTLAAGFDKLAEEWLAPPPRQRERPSDKDSQQISDLRQLAVRCREFADIDYSFLIRQGTATSDHRLRRRQAPLRRELLRSAGFGSSPGQFCRYLAGKAAAGPLVRTWPGPDHRRTRPALLSWSGSMFEYLMPMLVMPTYDNTLLDETCRAAVKRQIQYGRQRNVPWGFPNRATPRPMPSLIINILHSVFPGSDSSAGWRMTWSSHRMRPRWR